MPSAVTEYTREELLWQEKEWRKCSKDFGYWLDTYGHMWTKEGGDEVAFKLWEPQWDFAKLLMQKKKLICLKTRQLGISWEVSGYAIWKAMTNKNTHIYYTSIKLESVQEQFARMRFIFNYLPEWMKERAYMGGKDCKNNDSLAEFTNGSAIHAISSGKSSGHGTAPSVLICDEWARVENSVERWRALSPARGKVTQVIVVSTSDGMNNHFADLWFSSVAQKNEYHPVFYGVDRHPDYTEEFLEEQRKEFLGDTQGYLAAFPRTPEDAFQASNRGVFDIGLIRAWREFIEKHDYAPYVGRIDEVDAGVYEFAEDELGHFQMWVEPVDGHQYTLGVDVAQGLTDGDWSVIAVFDSDTTEVVALYRAKIAPEDYAYPILNIAHYYNDAWVCVEVNTASELLMSDLKAVYPWLYMRQQRARITDLPTLVPGFYSSATSKPRIILQMRRMFMDEDTPLAIYSKTILDEMAQYEQDDKGRLSAPKGSHDDCVIAVALAIEALSTMPFTQMDFSVRRQHQNRTTSWRSL